MSSMRLVLAVYVWTMCLCGRTSGDSCAPGLHSAFDVIGPPILQCNNSCDKLTDDKTVFLDTAPCPPIWNLSLICQRSYSLQCWEVAAILDRCIFKYEVDCTEVFSTLDACVCDFNMSCSAMNEMYFNNCGWRENDYSCQRTSTTLPVTTPRVVNSTSPSGGNNDTTDDTESSSGDGDSPDDSASASGDTTTPLIGGSRSTSDQLCGPTCVVIAAVLCPGLILVVAIGVYWFCKRYNSKPGKTEPMAMTKVNCVDAVQKRSKSICSTVIHPEKEKQFTYPIMEKSLSNGQTPSLNVGRPCSSFCTNMFHRPGPENLQYYNAPVFSMGQPWDGQFEQNLPLSESGSMTLKIPRPSLVTFKYSVENQPLFDQFISYTNPVYEESSH